MVVAKRLSDLDLGGVLKDAHNEYGHSLRVTQANSQVPAGYSRVEFTRNAFDSITEAKFYRGTTAQKTRVKFFGDVAGSLNGKYWLINAAEDAVQHYVWYNNGTGVDPALSGKVGIEIPIVDNDPASVVCLATRRYLENCPHYSIEANGDDVLLIENVKNGQCTASSDFNTGFGITTTNVGITKNICSVILPEETGIRYVYNYGEKKFEIFPVLTLTGTVDVNVVSPDPLPVYMDGILVSVAGIQNIPAPVAGTEYSFVLAAGVKRFEVTSRSGNAKMQVCFIAGQSGTNYRTIRAGSVWEEKELILAAPITVYFQTNKNSEVIEVLTYS